MAYFPPTGSTVAFQTDATKLAANVSVTGGFLNVLGSVATAPFPASVSGVGIFNINPTGGGSVVAVLKDSSVAALQGTNPWKVELTSGSVITTGGNSSVQLLEGNAPIGSVTALQGTNPWVISNSSVQVNNIATGNTSVQLISTSASIAVQVNRILQGVSSVQVIGGIGVIGSVAVLQGTNPWVVGNSSVQVVNQVPTSVSGVGIFNVNHIGVGSIFTGFRNDALASTLGADLTSRLVATDSAGRTVTKPFAPEEARVVGVGSTVNINPSSLFAVAGAGLRNYLTNYQIANEGSVATLVTFRDGDASIIAKTIAPAGGGSNAVFLTPIRTGGFNQPIEYTAKTAVSILHVTATGYKAP